jgi:hypothetical protein
MHNPESLWHSTLAESLYLPLLIPHNHILRDFHISYLFPFTFAG